MRRILAAILLVAVVVLTAAWIAGSAYQAGLVAGTAATAGSAAGGATVIVPAHGLGWWGLGGFGWPIVGLGFGFFGLLFTLLFVFLVIGLIRAIVFGGHRGHHRDGRWDAWGGGPAGPRGSWGVPSPGRWSGDPEAEAALRRAWWGRGEDRFAEWHRQAHEGSMWAGQPGPQATVDPTATPGQTAPVDPTAPRPRDQQG